MTLDFEHVYLSKGAHSPNGHACVMEWVSQKAGEKWSDHPECADPCVAAFLRDENDTLSDEDRQALAVLIEPLSKMKVSKKLTAKRELMFFDWAIREAVPEWLDLANLHREAKSLRDLHEITNRDFLRAANEPLAASGAASGAASERLHPTVLKLRDSAIRMVLKMCAMEE